MEQGQHMVQLVAFPPLLPLHPFTAVPHEYYQAFAARERHVQI